MTAGARPQAPDTAQLADKLRSALGGGEDAVVWTDCGEEVVVHAREADVRRRDDALIAEIPLETEQTGRHVLAVMLVAGPSGPMTAPRPAGEERLAKRWGEHLQQAVADVLGPELRAPGGAPSAGNGHGR